MDRRIVTPYEGSGARAWDGTAPIDAPLLLHDTRVPAAWVDYNGHMSEWCYLLAVGDAMDAFFRYVGVDDDYRAAGRSLYTAETHLHHRREAHEGDLLAFALQLLDRDARRLHVWHELRRADTGEPVAYAEQLLAHVDMRAGRSSPMPTELADRVDAVLRAHAVLPVPERAGRLIRIRHS